MYTDIHTYTYTHMHIGRGRFEKDLERASSGPGSSGSLGLGGCCTYLEVPCVPDVDGQPKHQSTQSCSTQEKAQQGKWNRSPQLPKANRKKRIYRGLKDHINRRILHSGSKAQDKGDARNHGFEWSFWAPNLWQIQALESCKKRASRQAASS